MCMNNPNLHVSQILELPPEKQLQPMSESWNKYFSIYNACASLFISSPPMVKFHHILTLFPFCKQGICIVLLPSKCNHISAESVEYISTKHPIYWPLHFFENFYVESFATKQTCWYCNHHFRMCLPDAQVVWKEFFFLNFLCCLLFVR